MSSDAWDASRLKLVLSDFDLERATELVTSWSVSAPTATGYRAAAEDCVAMRRYDLAARIRIAAFRAGADPYEAAYAVDALWRHTDRGEESALICAQLAAEVEEIEFKHQGDAFHRSMATQALNDLAKLARYECGELSLEECVAQPMHGIAVDAIWRRIWPAHNALQFSRAQRLAELYLVAAKPDVETTFYTIETFFVDYGGTQAALRILDGLQLSPDADLRRQALRMAMAYESGADDVFADAWARIVELQGGALGEAAQRSYASAVLFRIRTALNEGLKSAAHELCESGLRTRSSVSVAGAFELAKGFALEADDLASAVEHYELGLQAEDYPRNPFGLYSVADACAAAGRWDICYGVFERYAARLRPHYGALAPQQPIYTTASADSLPRSAVFLSGWSVGDDTFRYGLLRAHCSENDYTVMLDGRLVAMAQRAQPNWRFLPHTRVHEVGWSQFWKDRSGTPEVVDPLRCPRSTWRAAHDHGAVILQEDLLAVHAAHRMVTRYPNETPALEPEARRVNLYRQWLGEVCDGAPSIALSWRVLLQYDWTPDEIDQIQTIAGRQILIAPDLDIRRDLEGVAALARACDLVMSTGVATRDICAAAGARVYSISFGWKYADFWRRLEDGRDSIFPTLKHADPTLGREGVLDQAITMANDLCLNRHR
ncbi:MAG: hypothetical protein FD138_692 [Planctomycetota bacterium]|nr:MAG: hypothetical protein FD138_692 [Planctomycetota bacterium]